MNTIESLQQQFPCPDCGTIISETQTECPLCGRMFEGKEKINEPEEERKYECSECGEEVSESDTICPHCGETLVEEEVLCSHCGVSIPQSSKECPNCGTTFSLNLYKCPDCSAEILESDTACPTCGCVFAEIKINDEEKTENEEQQFFCSDCEEEVGKNDTTCSHCGAVIGEEEVINENDFQFWKSTTSEGELAFLKGMLDQENIPYVVMNEQSRSGFTFLNNPKKIFVAKDSFLRANTLYEEVSKAKIEMPTSLEIEQGEKSE